MLQAKSASAMKKTPTAAPSAHRLNPKSAIARKITGTTPTVRRITLIAISATMNSLIRKGLIIRLARLRDQISSRKEKEKPCCVRNRMSQSRTAPINVPAIRAGPLCATPAEAK